MNHSKQNHADKFIVVNVFPTPPPVYIIFHYNAM